MRQKREEEEEGGMRKRRWRQEKGEQANQQVKQITRAVNFGHTWIKSHVVSVSLASAARRTRRAHGANNTSNKLNTFAYSMHIYHV